MFAEWIGECQSEDADALLVMDAAVLLEAGWEDLADETWVVTVDPDIAVARATKRDGLDEAAVRKRIASQLSNAERSARADVVIDNSGDPGALTARLDSELARISG